MYKAKEDWVVSIILEFEEILQAATYIGLWTIEQW